MEKGDKGSTMIRMGVSGLMFLLVPAYPGCPGSQAVKRLLFRENGFVKFLAKYDFLLVFYSDCPWVCVESFAS